MIRRSWTRPASIEETLALWAASLREVKKRIRPLFGQERVARNAGLFLEGLLGDEQRKTGWMLSPGLAISVRKSNPLMKPGHDEQTTPATAKTMANALIIVATLCPERLSRNHALHHGRADALGAAVHEIRPERATCTDILVGTKHWLR
jgi:hypothetical protein